MNVLVADIKRKKWYCKFSNDQVNNKNWINEMGLAENVAGSIVN